jgi:proteasome lid subunit RPN8/RPN11
MTDKDKIHREILQEALNDKEEKKPSKFSKYSMIIITIVLIIVTITYLVGFHGIEFIMGRLASNTIEEDFTVNINDDQKVIMERHVYELLRYIFLENQRQEFKVCLVGEKVGDDYIVSALYSPKTYHSYVYGVTSEACSPETIIPLHSHPPDRCLFSEQDIESYEKFKEQNPDAIMGLMCDVNRFSFYGEQI